jgi:hypothetical protein
VQQALLVTLALPAFRAQLVQLAPKGLLAWLVVQAQLVLPETRVLLVLLAPLEQPDLPAQLVLRARLVLKVILAQLVIPDLLV